jgi:hypothetical protein
MNVPLPSGIACVDLAAGGKLCAEPGQQLVIIDLEGFPDGGYGFAISFTSPVAQPVPFKTIFAAKVEGGGTDKYIPLFPCKSDFADVAPITIPTVTTMIEPLVADFDDDDLYEGCENVLVQLDLRAAAPLLGPYALAGVATLLLLSGIHVLNQRRKRAG